MRKYTAMRNEFCVHKRDFLTGSEWDPMAQCCEFRAT